MSLSALPEWKQLLLERKRREEEERERREREEEERLANMPAWKREIIQRRRAKQDEERERDVQRTPDVLSSTEDIITEQMDGKLTHHLQTDYKVQKQISKDTISPIQHNPFIRSENSFRRENECKKATNKAGRDRSKNESTSPFSPVVGLRTIQANNIIIIEKDKSGLEKLEKRDKEVEEDEKRMRMDLREFLAGGGSVTEIRASEVLIIKPPVTLESGGKTESLEKEGIWSSVRSTSKAVMQRAERVLNHKDRVTPERSGRVSQLLSKFGEHPKPPMRSKSTDSFNRPGRNRARYSTGDLSVQDEPNTEDTENSQNCRGVPKRSFSFSDRVVCQQESRDHEEKRVVERTQSDRRIKTRGTDQSESKSRATRRWGRPKHDEMMKDTRRNDSGKSVDGGEGFTVASVIKNPQRMSSSERDMRTGSEEKQIMIKQKPTESSVGASRQSHDVHIPPLDTTDLSADVQCQCVNTPSRQAVLTQHTEDLLSKLGKIQSDMEVKSAGLTSSDTDDLSKHQQYENISKRATEETHASQLPQQAPKLCTQEGIKIPRTVFYGVDIAAKMRRSSLPAGDGGQMERRGSWKAGRPLTRVESLKEKIRQQEKERHDEAEGTVSEREETTLQTLRPFDVTQDVSMAKSSPQLPVPVSLSLLLSASTEREVGEITGDASESHFCLRETEKETERHVEACGRAQDSDGEEDKGKLLEEEYLPPSLSPSPTLSDSLDAMSRIYNLKAVGSKTAVCISERTADIPPHGGLQGKYNPIRQPPSPDVLPETAKLWNHDKTETGVQRQVERLQLRDPEAGCGSPDDRTSCRPITEPEVKTAEGQKRPDILRETQKRFPQAQKSQQVRSFTINARNTDSSAKPPEQNSPSSSSPCTASPSSSPSPPLFSIRSASGGASKRGTTITITPRRPAGSSSPVGTPAVPKAAPQSHASTPAPVSTREAGKKRYPTAEEIEVIGGYQNLERSCLVKSRGTPKAVKVCFDEVQLERVCEYPSEDCVLASLPYFPQSGLEDRERDEQEEDEEEEESSARASPTDLSVSAGRGRFLKVDESCKRLSK